MTGGSMRHVRDYTGWDPAFIPLGVVWARCSHHEIEALAAWALFQGSERRHVALWHSLGYQRPEYVGDYAAPGTPEREHALSLFSERGSVFGPGNLPVAAPDDGETRGYWREVVECTRPSCGYRAELGRSGGRLVRQLLEALAEAHGYVVEREASKTPAVVIEVNDFLRDPGPYFRSVAGS